MMTYKQLTVGWRHSEPLENEKSSDSLTKGVSSEDAPSWFLRHSSPSRHGVYFAHPLRNLEQERTRQPLFCVTVLSSNSRH